MSGALAQLAVFPIQFIEPHKLVAGRPGPNTGVTLFEAHPLVQRLGAVADLRCDRAGRRPLRRMIRRVLQNHAHRRHSVSAARCHHASCKCGVYFPRTRLRLSSSTSTCRRHSMTASDMPCIDKHKPPWIRAIDGRVLRRTGSLLLVLPLRPSTTSPLR